MLLTLVLVYSARRYGVRLVVYVQFSSVGVGTVWGGAALLFILGSNLGGVGPGRGLRGEEEGGGMRSRPGAARTILLFHTISVRPSKQPQIMEYVPSPKVFDV